ncbi:Pfs domain protein [Halenospora varia]|nr:Pfs domain protein [Halenospora varia]
MANKKLRYEPSQKAISSTSKIRLSHNDYTVGWICALPLEMAAAKTMLDEVHLDLLNDLNDNDNNSYTFGRMEGHNVVITGLPAVAGKMLSSFRRIRFGLMVGVGGGVPGGEDDIRLGDIVVSQPARGFGGVVQYDYGKTVQDGRLERTGVVNKPPEQLLTAVTKLQGNHRLESSRIPAFLTEMANKYPTWVADFASCGQENDQLFEAKYDHSDSKDTCANCDKSKLVVRSTRGGNDPLVHYGLVASGDKVMKDAGTRDRVAGELGILCFEMEAAGLMDNFPCLVVRGICDYADSHKNKQWQGYAAATAAAYAKELLSVMPASQVEEMPTLLQQWV